MRSVIFTEANCALQSLVSTAPPPWCQRFEQLASAVLFNVLAIVVCRIIFIGSFFIPHLSWASAVSRSTGSDNFSRERVRTGEVRAFGLSDWRERCTVMSGSILAVRGDDVTMRAVCSAIPWAPGVADSQPRGVNIMRKSRDRLHQISLVQVWVVYASEVWTRQITPTPPSGFVLRCDVDVYHKMTVTQLWTYVYMASMWLYTDI